MLWVARLCCGVMIVLLAYACRTSSVPEVKKAPVPQDCESIVRSQQSDDRIMGLGSGHSQREADDAARDDIARQVQIVVASVTRVSQSTRRTEIETVTRASTQLVLPYSRIVERCRGSGGVRLSVAVVSKSELGDFYSRQVESLLSPYVLFIAPNASGADMSQPHSPALQHKWWRRWKREKQEIIESISLCRYLSSCSTSYKSQFELVERLMTQVSATSYSLSFVPETVPVCLPTSLQNAARESGYTFVQGFSQSTSRRATARCEVSERASPPTAQPLSLMELNCTVDVLDGEAAESLRFAAIGTGFDSESAQSNACARLKLEEG